MEQINTFLGSTYAKEDATSVLKALGFEVTDATVKVPYWRQGDVTHWQDLAEEIGRILGFDQIVARLPLASVPVNEPTADMKVRQALREQFRALGFDQVINFPMISPKDYSKLGLEVPSGLVLQNPLSPEESVMRPQLLPSLLKVTTHNLRRQQSNGRYVEFGRVFSADGNESLRCEAIVEGLQQPAAYQEKDRRAISEFAYLRGIIENVLIASGCKGFHIEPSTDTRFHPKVSAQVCVKDTVVARFGVLHPFLTEEYNIKQELGISNSILMLWQRIAMMTFEFTPFSKFPASDKDVAFVVPKSVSYQTLYTRALEFKPTMYRYFNI